ncbi:ribosomal protein S18-alanine N-acetyltransferase [Actinomadura viridis]|uniref:Ribosomal-protein-alanine N-acetyltransferase n=1 Tax=Actinomadura viridis TaxID=58110 RepID=A0A931GGL9_9ACTN|nr:ribosomal protein S18-alanine N-acetyltransferase [Actinomadura viridis]MBG6086480.1 ribosomal-protein-alanine N-acetyltransferase [Actinomadura viridis]
MTRPPGGAGPDAGPDAVALRPMTAADLPAVLELERILFPEDAWSEAMLREELEHQPATRHYVVAEVAPEAGGGLAGYAGLAASGGQGDVQTIGVLPARQGTGLGAALLTALLDEAARRACDEVFLEVRAGNDRAQRLYERFGFERIGVRKRYYQPSGADAIVMRRQLHAARPRPNHPIGFSREDQSQ